jgi:tRNA dimethylallyltransferase
VVNADALQVYRGFDVGTAKPTAAERARVPHHLIDLVPPEAAMDVATWTVGRRGGARRGAGARRRPLVVGGTGFYVDALERGLPTTPPADPALRAALEAELAERGAAALLAELRAAAPADASGAQGNPRRVLRALEVLRATGRPPSAFPRRPPRFALRTFAALPTPPRSTPGWRPRGRHARGRLARRGRRPGRAGAADGARLAGDRLRGPRPRRAGRGGAGAHRCAITLATRRYAKRQRTWFARRPTDAIRTVGLDAWARRSRGGSTIVRHAAGSGTAVLPRPPTVKGDRVHDRDSREEPLRLWWVSVRSRRTGRGGGDRRRRPRPAAPITATARAGVQTDPDPIQRARPQPGPLTRGLPRPDPPGLEVRVHRR